MKGNFKKKLGIKRERVPFVLPEDFTRVIAKGNPNPIETTEFEKLDFSDFNLIIKNKLNWFIFKN